MSKIGAYEAKTKLANLLERVAEGEHITITKHGMPVATLAPVPERERRPATEVIADLRAPCTCSPNDNGCDSPFAS